MERTFIAIKPDGVQRKLVAEIIGHFEQKGFKLSSPVVAIVLEGDGVVAAGRKIIGATNPLNSEPGTIRGDYGASIGRNLIHGSDAIETAQSEIAMWFKEDELVAWEPAMTKWIYE